ncbi:hypothetical protein [Rhodopila sp.]|uniref:hypothetical protein n=1 Tax=Rhodopila sp. TaxID=2480087 RepID=UPI003D0DF1EE
MKRWLAPVAVLVAFGAAGPASAGEGGSVCRQGSVVDEMNREIRDGNYYDRIDPKLVTETPTADPNVVRCQVCVQSAPYNTTRFGDQPIRQCVPHGFDIQILPSGFVVHNLK